MEMSLLLLIPGVGFFPVKNGEHYENKNIGDLIPVMVITKTKLALEKKYFLKPIFSFSVLALILYFSPHLHLVYSFIEIPESQILCLISSVAVRW